MQPTRQMQLSLTAQLSRLIIQKLTQQLQSLKSFLKQRILQMQLTIILQMQSQLQRVFPQVSLSLKQIRKQWLIILRQLLLLPDQQKITFHTVQLSRVTTQHSMQKSQHSKSFLIQKVLQRKQRLKFRQLLMQLRLLTEDLLSLPLTGLQLQLQ